MADKALRLPSVKASPSTLLHSKHKLRSQPFYQPGFQMTKEQWKDTLAKPTFQKTDPLMPRYPYGRNAHFPEANYGLYGGATIMSGNKISKGRNKGKTLRKWFPNIRLEKIRSEALDMELKIPIRARVIRTIKKCGGLDEYLLGHKPARIKELGLLGWKLRWMVLRSPRMARKLAEERKKYGLDTADPNAETFDDVWNDPEKRQKLIEQQDQAWTRLRYKMQKFEQHIVNQWESSDKPPESYADFFDERSGTLSERLPSSIGLPERIKAMDINEKTVAR